MNICNCKSIVRFALDAVHKFLIGKFLLLVVDHRELVCLKLVFLEFQRFTHKISQLDDFPTFGIVFDGLLAHICKFINCFVVDLCEELLGT